MTKVRKPGHPHPAPQAQGSFPAGGEVCLAEDRISVRPQDWGGPLVCLWVPLLSWVHGLVAGDPGRALCLWVLTGPAAWSHARQCETEDVYSWSRVFWRVYLETWIPHCWESPLEKPQACLEEEAKSIVASVPREVLEQSQETFLAAKSAMTFQDVLLKGLYPGAGGGNLTMANCPLEMKLNSHLLPLASGCVRNISIHLPRKCFSPGSSGAWLDPVLVAPWPHLEGPENGPELVSLLQESVCLSTSQPLTLPPSAWYSFSSAPSSLASPKSVIFTCCGVFTSTFLAARSLCTKRRSSR